MSDDLVSTRADLLAKLLLIQNIATVYPDKDALLSFVCRGLEGFPGVVAVRHHAGGVPDQSMHGADRIILPLKQNRLDLGAFIVEVNNKTIIHPYLPYLLNTVTMLGVILENREHEARMRLERNQFFDISIDMLCIAGADGFFKELNHRWEETLGWSSEELLSKPFISFVHPEDVRSTLTELQRLTAGESCIGFQNRYRCKNGLFCWLEWAAAAKGSVIFAVARNITERKEAEEEIQHLAFYDPLTHLANRRLLRDRLQQAMAASARNQRQGALLFIDLDHFKTLNDTLGHDVGDQLLQQVAQRLIDSVREDDMVARQGGDEFVVMLEDLDVQPHIAAAQARTVGEKILAALNQPYRLTHHEHHSTSSLGVTLFIGHRETIEELLKQADMALYQAKAAGRNTLRFFDPKLQARIMARSALETDLRAGLRDKQFLLYYQPQVDSKGRLLGAEALVRWRHPRRGMISPADFIPLAEETGLILPLGAWVLDTACAQLAAWACRPGMAALTLAINVSAWQFRQSDFASQVLEALDRWGVRSQRLKLELTESLLLDNLEDTITKMTVLKTRGVGFSLDDFGTGYSSLAYLKNLPLDQLKIDQSFVREILADPKEAAIAQTIVALARNLGLEVIAEGVETAAQRDFLIRSGCYAFQGYFYGRPEPAEALEAFPGKFRSAAARNHHEKP